jgi:RNA polymerase sigma factor (sigma-70 family)
MTCAGQYREPKPVSADRMPAVRNTEQAWALVLTVRKVVESVARRYSMALPSLRRLDAEQAGWMGAFRAAQLWTEDGGASFPTYARLWVTKRVRQAADHSRAVTLPERARLMGATCGVGDGDKIEALDRTPEIQEEREDFEDEMADLDDAIEALPLVEREAVKAYFINEDSAREAAVEFGLGTADIESALGRGLARLRHMLAGGAEPPAEGIVGLQVRLVDAEVAPVQRAKTNRRATAQDTGEQRGLFGGGWRT